MIFVWSFNNQSHCALVAAVYDRRLRFRLLSAVVDRRYSRHPTLVRLPPVDWIQYLQWPAMVVTLLSAYLVAAQSKTQRQWGFWFFLLSNILWVAWGWHARAWALIILQFGLAALNIRGVAKNERA